MNSGEIMLVLQRPSLSHSLPHSQQHQEFSLCHVVYSLCRNQIAQAAETLASCPKSGRGHKAPQEASAEANPSGFSNHTALST